MQERIWEIYASKCRLYWPMMSGGVCWLDTLFSELEDIFLTRLFGDIVNNSNAIWCNDCCVAAGFVWKAVKRLIRTPESVKILLKTESAYIASHRIVRRRPSVCERSRFMRTARHQSEEDGSRRRGWHQLCCNFLPRDRRHKDVNIQNTTGN